MAFPYVIVFAALSLLVTLRCRRAAAASKGGWPCLRILRGSQELAPQDDVTYFLTAISFAAWPNIFLRASSSNGSFTNLPTASPACTCGRARTWAYQRLTFG